MHTVNVQFRVDARLKSQAEKILDDMGMDITTLLRATLKRVVKIKDFPFALGTSEDIDENGFTKKQRKELRSALKELDNPKAKRFGPFTNAEDLIKSLKS